MTHATKEMIKTIKLNLDNNEQMTHLFNGPRGVINLQKYPSYFFLLKNQIKLELYCTYLVPLFP